MIKGFQAGSNGNFRENCDKTMRLLHLKDYIARCVWIAAITLSAHVAALDFDIQTIELSPKHSFDIVPLSSKTTNLAKLLVVETPETNQLERQMRGKSEEPIRRIKLFQQKDALWSLGLELALDESMDLIDITTGPQGNQVVGLQGSQLVYLDETTLGFKPLIDTSSMFIGRHWGSSPLMEMFADVNGDGLDDFLMPTFAGWTVALQTEAGYQASQLVGPRPSMSFRDNARYVAYRAEEAFFVDENNDGLNDIAFWQDGYFKVYRQNALGEFSRVPVKLDPNLRDMLGGYAQITLGEDAKNNKGKNRLLDEVVDINNDGVADLIVKNIKAEGIFGWESEIEVYLGEISDNQRLVFEKSPSSTIRTEGFQFDNERLDISGDGNQEFLVTSVDISIGAVIRALIARSVSVDVSIYKMDDGQFPAKPSIRKSISARFDFGSGDLFVPAVLGADVTGDGHKDLLVQKGEGSLLVYPGEQGEKIFAKKPIKLSLALPASRTKFLVFDLDQNGRDELVLSHDGDRGSALSVVSFKD